MRVPDRESGQGFGGWWCGSLADESPADGRDQSTGVGPHRDGPRPLNGSEEVIRFGTGDKTSSSECLRQFDLMVVNVLTVRSPTRNDNHRLTEVDRFQDRIPSMRHDESRFTHVL